MSTSGLFINGLELDSGILHIGRLDGCRGFLACGRAESLSARAGAECIPFEKSVFALFNMRRDFSLNDISLTEEINMIPFKPFA